MSTLKEQAEVFRIMSESGSYSKWEKDFLASIAEQLEAGRNLTANQLEKIAQIQMGR